MEDENFISKCVILSPEGVGTIDIFQPFAQVNSLSPSPMWEVTIQCIHVVQKKNFIEPLHDIGAPIIITCSNSYHMSKSTLGQLEKHRHPLAIFSVDTLPAGHQ